MRRAVLAVTLMMIAATPADAGGFEAYEGPNAVTHGSGGTRVEKDGVDFWTTGTPPRAYRILGVITDKRGTGVFHGSAVGSPGVVRRVKELGGDAVIVLNQDTQVRGAMVTNGVVGVARRATTRLLVVRYEAEAPSPVAP